MHSSTSAPINIKVKPQKKQDFITAITVGNSEKKKTQLENSPVRTSHHLSSRAIEAETLEDLNITYARLDDMDDLNGVLNQLKNYSSDIQREFAKDIKARINNTLIQLGKMPYVSQSKQEAYNCLIDEQTSMLKTIDDLISELNNDIDTDDSDKHLVFKMDW